MGSGARGSGKKPWAGTGGGLWTTRFSSIDSSEQAGDARASEAALGEVATSDKDEVPGLCFIFLDGEGVSRGPGVSEARLSLDLGSSGVHVSTI